MGGDSFGMAAPNDHCHGPCTMSFPRFQCVERQRLLTASFLLQKEAKDCIGKLFNGITLYLPSLSEFNYDSFSFFLSISVLFLGLFGKIEFIHAHHSCFNLFSSVYRMRFPSFFFLSKITIMKFEFKSGVIIMMNNYPYNV